jgi:hypothetical protein
MFAQRQELYFWLSKWKDRSKYCPLFLLPSTPGLIGKREPRFKAQGDISNPKLSDSESDIAKSKRAAAFAVGFMDSKYDLFSIYQDHSLEPKSTKQCRKEPEMLIELCSITYFWVKLNNSNLVYWCHDGVINEFLKQKQDSEITISRGKIRLPYFTNGLRAKCCISDMSLQEREASRWNIR